MANGYRVARCGETLFAQVVGLANMVTTPLLDEFLKTEIAQGARRACIDLSDCHGMDSTFMGTLVGFAGRFGDIDGQLVIVNPTAENLRLLDMLGVSTIVPVVGTYEIPAIEFIDLTSSDRQTPRERAEMMVDAHRHLMALSDENQAKFAPFIAALEKDLNKTDS